ncbi:MAG: methyltransferase domain-containing protein [Actinomycetales bacterium]|nr:methyltransferase domain-containing protein [Actinomycetales bacterium]
MGRYDRIAALAALDAHEGPEPIQVAELGAGHGRTVRALLAGAAEAGVPIRVHAIDTGSCLDDDVLHDERVRSLIVPEDQPLPFRDATLDRVISLNVLEHLPHPAGHLLECHRVLRPGGLLVLAHSDWDTVLFASEDDALTRLLIDRFVNDVPDGVRNADGFMGRKLLGLADASPLEVISVGAWADVHLRFDEDSVAWKVAMGVLAATRDDPRLAAAAAGWVEGLRRLARQGRFLFTVTDVALVLRRPVPVDA